MRFFTSPTPVDPAANYGDLTSAATLRYDMDVGPDGDSTIYADGIGSGIADIYAYLPVSSFGGASDSDFLYLYTEMGGVGGIYAADNGFEEWGFRMDGSSPDVPDAGSTITLMGLALLALRSLKR